MLFGGKKKKDKQNSSANDIETIVGENTEIEGTINATGSLRIDGKLTGKLKTQGDVVVGENGVLKADIEAKNVTVAGSVNGDVVADGKLVIVSTGKLIGDIKITNLIIEDGAIFKGKSESKSATTKRFTEEKTNKDKKKNKNKDKKIDKAKDKKKK